MGFVKLNDDPITIECVPDEHEESRDFTPSFWFRNRRHYLDDYVRTHNNPWMGCAEFPEYIHGMEADVYVKPLFIEIVDNGDAVNVYEEIAMRTFKNFIQHEFGIAMPAGDINGEWFVENGLPMIVACCCCGMTMSSPSAWLDDDGNCYCSSCSR